MGTDPVNVPVDLRVVWICTTDEVVLLVGVQDVLVPGRPVHGIVGAFSAGGLPRLLHPGLLLAGLIVDADPVVCAEEEPHNNHSAPRWVE